MTQIAKTGQQGQPQAARTTTSSLVLLGQYPTSPEQAREAEKEIERLNTIASPNWVAQRVVKFLTGHYYVADMAAPVAESVGRDWTRELVDLPDWAIEEALTWWISRHNAKRGKKPLPGDISAHAHRLAAAIKVGQRQIMLFRQYGDNPPSWVKK